MSFSKTFWNRSLRKCLPIKLVRLVLMIILNKSFGKFSFRNSAYSRTIRSNNTSFQQQFQTANFCSFIFPSFANKIQNQQSADSFQRNLCQLQVLEQQLGQQQFSQTTQLLKEEACRTGSFQHQLGRVLPRELWQTAFRPTPFSTAASEQPASEEQLSAAQLGTPQLQREDLAQGACNNLCQEQLDRQPCLSELLLCHLGFAEGSFRTAWREQPWQEAACRKQPYPDRRRSLQRTASQNRLSRSQLEPAAFQQQLGSAQWGQSSFTTRTSSRRASRRRACRQELWQEDLGSNQLANKTFYKTASEQQAWRRELYREQLWGTLPPQLSRNSLQRSTSTRPASTATAFQQKLPPFRTAFHPAACQERASEQKPLQPAAFRTELSTGSFTDSSLTETTFRDSSLAEQTFRPAALRRTPFRRTASQRTASTLTFLRRTAFQTRAWQRRALTKAALHRAASQRAALKQAALKTAAWKRPA